MLIRTSDEAGEKGGGFRSEGVEVELSVFCTRRRRSVFVSADGASLSEGMESERNVVLTAENRAAWNVVSERANPENKATHKYQ